MGLSAGTGARSGEVLKGKYRLEALIGSGGMGDVYRARNVMIERVVAIKMLHPAHAANADIVGRFLREAKAANLVRHRNVVEVLDVDQDEHGVPFIVQEYLEGEDLGITLDKIDGGLSLRVALGLLVPVVEAVASAHAKGLVHRDLKPDNVFLTLGQDAGTIVPKVLDFGISKMPTNAGDVRMTAGDMIMGTPAYMSPEQIQAPWLVDARADIWALGVIVHEALTGQLPFRGDSPGALFQEICTQDPIPLQEVLPDAPADVIAIVKRCMQRDPAARYANANDLARDLDAARKRIASDTLNAAGKPLPPAVGRAAKQKQVSAAEAIARTMSSARVATNPGTPAPRRTDKEDPRNKWGAFESLAPAPPNAPGVPMPAMQAPRAPMAMPSAPRPSASATDITQGIGADFGTGNSIGTHGARAPRGDDSRRLDLAALPASPKRRQPTASHAGRPSRERPRSGQSGGLTFHAIFGVIQAVALCGSVVVLRPFLQQGSREQVSQLFGSLSPVVFVVAALALLVAGLTTVMNAMRVSSVGLAVAALGLLGVAATAAIAAAPYSNPPIDVTALLPMSERFGPWAAALVAIGFSIFGIARARDVLRGGSDMPQSYAALLIIFSLAGFAVGVRVVSVSSPATAPTNTDATSVGFEEEY